MNASQYEREPSVPPARIETMAGLRRRFRRGEASPASAEGHMPDLFEMISEANVFPSQHRSAPPPEAQPRIRHSATCGEADGV
jgi:hypothetical protein